MQAPTPYACIAQIFRKKASEVEGEAISPM